MGNNYLCPKCRSVLNIENNIIFTVKTKDNQRGLILLSVKLGDYSVKNQDNLTIEKGDKVQFFCPICRENLSASDINENLARVIMQDDEENEYQILFSIVAGEYCTYMVSEDFLKAYGDDSSIYLSDL
ncbi:MAG: hypothetical protein HY958_07790 [Bacteroidia bacterium]|nr:hypothetical protein [Bacteroidia bacterium]